MIKLFRLLAILVLFNSCKEKTNNNNVKSSQADDINPTTDPCYFKGAHKAKAMILGVFHFSNPGLDSYKQKFPFNIFDDKRQSELDTLLARISKYKPTKILVEWNRINMDSITNVRYNKYVRGEFSIDDKSNEVYQIGFKLAKKLGHTKIYCSDASANWFGVELDWDNYDEDSYLKSKGQYRKARRYNYESFYSLGDSLKTIQSLSEHFIWLNSYENRLKDHQAYLTSIIEGAGDNYLGADAVANWYRRNLKIFANAYDFTDFDKEDRLLLIYGSGHVWSLRQFFIDSPDYDYVEVNKFLKN